VKEVNKIHQRIQELQVKLILFFCYYVIRLIGTGGNTSSTGGNEMDVTRLTEDEQIALAIQMSMTQAESASMLSLLLLFNK
jgi:uncharacterized protein YgbK (DUF1537 family)